MKKTLVVLAVMATGIAHAGEIALGSTWSEFAQGFAASVTTSDETSGGFSVDVAMGCYVYQAVSLGDFSAEPFGTGDTVTITFTTTMDADAAQAEDLAYRFMLWDEINGGCASARLDWGAPAGDTARVGVGDNASPTLIGSLDDQIGGVQVPYNVFNTSNETSTVSLSVSKIEANLFNVSLTWDGIQISDRNLENATADPMDSISAIGFRLAGSANTTNTFTISNVSVEVAPTPAGTTLTHQIGGDDAVRDQGWTVNTSTNEAATPSEFSWSFGAPTYYRELSNVTFTVTAVEANDAMYIQGTHLAGTNGHSSRLDTNEVIQLTVSYVDPDNKLLDLKVASFGPWWNTNPDEETLFSDGATVFAMQDSDNGVMAGYDATGLTPLSLANAGTWSMLVYQTNNTTTSGLGGFKLEYRADVDFIAKPADKPFGNVVFTDTWGFRDVSSNMAVLAESSDGFSVAMTNSTSKRFMYKMDENAFNVPFQVGETATWSFTATVGTALGLNGGDKYFQGSLWDTGADTANNGVTFQVDWGTPSAPTMYLGKSKVTGITSIGATGGAATSTLVPSNALDAPGKSADFVITLVHETETNVVAYLSYDDVTLTQSYETSIDSLDELGFRFKDSDDNALIISDMSLVITNPNFDYYGHWTIYEKFLTEGVNDAEDADPDNDKMENLMEYALGGNPLVDDAEFFLPTANQGGSYLNLVYRRRLDADDRGLDYNVYSTTDLITAPITNPTEEVGSAAIDTEFESVTNRVSTAVESKQFMRLEVSK